MKKLIALCLTAATLGSLSAQQQDTVKKNSLTEVSIQSERTRVSRLSGAENGTNIGQDELFRAACCNLGESFSTNPSVDVNYNDAAVGARQIKLLGLSGIYVQMLTEGLLSDNASQSPYLLSFIPGTWMKSIQVSKGASSVKNGYQSITGQIDVEYLKPEDDQGIIFNLYGDSRLKSEANFVGNLHLNKHLSTEILAHAEHEFMHHDVNNDGWIDLPSVDQQHIQNRWKYMHGRYIMHAGLGYLRDNREGGQVHSSPESMAHIGLHARRLEGYMKHAYLLNRQHNTNIALLASASRYDLNAHLVRSKYLADQYFLNSQLILEHEFNNQHLLSSGLSLTSDALYETSPLVAPLSRTLTSETTPGAYIQYTFKPTYRFTAMGGIRVDHSSLFHRTFFTPRLHLKWIPSDHITLRASAGKGYRSPRALAENHYLLSSGRVISIDDSIAMEEAINTGLCATFYIPIASRNLTLSAEYYYTDFQQQMVVDFEQEKALHIYNLNGRSFSHTFQIEASYDFSEELNAMAAFRVNDVRCTYGNQLMEKPLTSRYKGLLTLSWNPMMALWHFDITLQLNGGGRMPTPYTTPDGSPSWDESFPAYPQLNMQIARDFRNFSFYIGAENITNFSQQNTVICASNPFDPSFDPSMVWGPVHGIMAYAGLRLNLWRL